MGHKKNSRRVSFKRFRRSREKYPGLFESENGMIGRLICPVYDLKGTEVRVKHSLDKKKDFGFLETALKELKKKVERDKIRASSHDYFMSLSERRKQKSRRIRRTRNNK